MSRITALILSVLCTAVSVQGQKPIVQTRFTADPAPMVWGDTVFLYTSHDENDAEGFHMKDWLLYTSTDMANWTDHGTVASLSDFPWAADDGAWAPQVVERGGRYFMYCPVAQRGAWMAIGVLTADSPYGPFSDPIGKPLIVNSIEDIDPTVFIDDDGQAYLYWGNPHLYYVRLGEDMISYEGDIVRCDTIPSDYQEGPWLYKHDGRYYLAYASTCCPEGIGYAVSDEVGSVWHRAGTVMDHNPKSSGNHPGIIHFRGNNYLFGFGYQLHQMESDVHCERRSVCCAQFEYGADGSIPELAFWDEQHVEQLSPLDPFRRVEAETIAWADGVTTARGDSVGMYVTAIHNTDYIRVRGVDFGQGAASFTASVASISREGDIELRLDSLGGTRIGGVHVGSTGGRSRWCQRTCPVEGATGVHDLFLVFTGEGKWPLFDFDWWQFAPTSP